MINKNREIVLKSELAADSWRQVASVFRLKGLGELDGNKYREKIISMMDELSLEEAVREVEHFFVAMIQEAEKESEDS